MWALTIAWIALILPMAMPLSERLFAMAPSDFGASLSGAFSPLAFAWLVYGYLLQRHELELQRNELRLQRDELHSLVDAQRAQADATERLGEKYQRLVDAENERLEIERRGSEPAIRCQYAGAANGAIKIDVFNEGAPARSFALTGYTGGWRCDRDGLTIDSFKAGAPVRLNFAGPPGASEANLMWMLKWRTQTSDRTKMVTFVLTGDGSKKIIRHDDH